MQRKKTGTPNIIYYEHKTRKHNGRPDRRFLLRYRFQGRQREEAIGWASEGWNVEKAAGEMADLKRNQRRGSGPVTLAEKRELAEEKRTREKNEAVTFGDYWTDKYYSSDKEKKSYDREKSLYDLWIEPEIGAMSLKEVRPFHLEKIKTNMSAKNRSPRSIQYCLAVIRQVFNSAIQNEVYAGSNPAVLVKKPTVKNQRVRFLSKPEADSLLAELKSRSQSLWEICLLSLHTGMRAGEVFGMTWGRVNLDAGSIDVMDSKGLNRTVFMTSDVKRMLDSKEEGKPNDLIWRDRNGNRIKEISNSFNRAVDAKGLEFNKGVTDRRHKLTFHSLRHSHASWLVQNGVDLYTVQKVLGHSEIKMTERYAHLAPDNLQAAVKVFEDSL